MTFLVSVIQLIANMLSQQVYSGVIPKVPPMIHLHTVERVESLSRRFHLDNNFNKCNIGRSVKA